MKATPNYQVLKAELDEIILQLQSESIDIDEATKLYERATELINQLEKYLANAENVVKRIKPKTKRSV